MSKTAEGSSKTIVYAALVGNLLVAITKIGAAVWTGRTAMMSEAVHSVVDTTNEVLLLTVTIARAVRPMNPIRLATGASCTSGASLSLC